MNREQKLVDLLFKFTIVSAQHMHGRTSGDIAAWVRANLDACGFKTQPIGSSWGVLS